MTPNAVARNTLDFLKAGLVCFFQSSCQSKYLFSSVGIKDKYYDHKGKMSIKHGEQKQVLYTQEEFKCSV